VKYNLIYIYFWMMWHVQVARTVKVQVGHSGGKIKNSDIARLDYLKKKIRQG
jgi:hypothetical protein